MPVDTLAELVGVCDINPERARRSGERLGVPWFTQAEEMLASLRPDVCSVATGGYEYSSDHYAPTLQALRAGCHVLCEKPISNDIEHAREMVQRGKTGGALLSASISIIASRLRRASPKSGWTQDGWAICCSSTWPSGSGSPESFDSPITI